MRYVLGEMTWPQVKELVRPDTVVVVPVGAIEQDGGKYVLQTNELTLQAAEAVTVRIRSADLNGQTVRVETGETDYGTLRFPLVGRHQAENLATAVATVETLGDLGVRKPIHHQRQDFQFPFR